MSNLYISIDEISDSSLVVEQAHIDDANAFVDSELFNRGIRPDEVTDKLPLPLLKSLARAWACSLAASAQFRDETSPLSAKAREYKAQAQIYANQISRASLGLTAPESALGISAFRWGRG